MGVFERGWGERLLTSSATGLRPRLLPHLCKSFPICGSYLSPSVPQLPTVSCLRFLTTFVRIQKL